MASDPIRIFCGADRSQYLAFRVLEHSIRARTEREVHVRTIDNTDAPHVIDPRHAPYTEFSFGRFAIPSLCAYAGKAVYMDSDMLVLRDIAELWDQPFDGARILIEVGSRAQAERGKHAAVMLLDCERLPWRVSEIVAGLGTRYDYDALMSIDPLLVPGDMADRIPAGWNDLDRYDAQRTRNIHFTEIRTQPWVCATHPLGHLWVDELRRLLAHNALDSAVLREEVREGHARPSLLIELGLADGADPKQPGQLEAYDLARGYVAHRRLLERFRERKRAIKDFVRSQAIARRPWLAWYYRMRYRA
jgi:hypothetical protein